MTLPEATDDFRPDRFYSPICTSGYLTPLQRKKLREKRNLILSPDDANVSEILNKTKSTSKGIKKAKIKRTPKLKPKEKVIKKVLKQKDGRDSFPQLQCSVAELIGHSKDGNYSKEKRFFKNRSPQHLKKAKFVMPLTCKKGLDFIVVTPLQPNKDATQRLRKNSVIDTSTESIDDSFDSYSDENQAISSKEKVLSNIEEAGIKQSYNCSSSSDISENMPVAGIKQCASNDYSNLCDIPKNLENKDSSRIFKNKKLQEIFDLFDWPSDEILLERQNKARAELRESLAATKSDTSFDDSNESSNIEDTSPSKKLFPIFSKNRQPEKGEIFKQSKGKKKSLNILDNSKGGEQLIIDAGQKEIGAKICKTCGMIYTIGQEEDEKLHAGYHQSYLINLKFSGWKKERVIADYMDGRIIQVRDTDENFGTKKIKDILFIVNRDLGFSTAGLPVRRNAMILLFISNDKRVNGCLVAEEIKTASRVVSSETSEKKSDGDTIWVLGNWYASSETVPAICGVNRIWVSHECRRRKIASRMLDCLRQNFLYGYVVEMQELAFTDPTVDGRNFAASYTGTDNFLVYK